MFQRAHVKVRGQLWASVLSSHHMGSRSGTQPIRFARSTFTNHFADGGASDLALQTCVKNQTPLLISHMDGLPSPITWLSLPVVDGRAGPKVMRA